ncbi:hypothetical protein SAMN04489732_1123 [Amycolatopsis saalfeldensis]|uniref:Uncharacterized protein n=1 Tax=Amycolatopsis saalfeldensis TaxID=394193 RepID=A0A1H8Y7S8_9PSEU|nr:hypothetical protein SAMN04489732_1123 [Amycolatopsis saalfeldensis]
MPPQWVHHVRVGPRRSGTPCANSVSVRETSLLRCTSSNLAYPAKLAPSNLACPAKLAPPKKAAPVKLAPSNPARQEKPALVNRASPAKNACSNIAAPAKLASTNLASPAKLASSNTASSAKSAPWNSTSLPKLVPKNLAFPAKLAPLKLAVLSWVSLTSKLMRVAPVRSRSMSAQNVSSGCWGCAPGRRCLVRIRWAVRRTSRSCSASAADVASRTDEFAVQVLPVCRRLPRTVSSGRRTPSRRTCPDAAGE